MQSLIVVKRFDILGDGHLHLFSRRINPSQVNPFRPNLQDQIPQKLNFVKPMRHHQMAKITQKDRQVRPVNYPNKITTNFIIYKLNF